MGTTIVYWGCFGTMEKNMGTALGFYFCCNPAGGIAGAMHHTGAKLRRREIAGHRLLDPNVDAKEPSYPIGITIKPYMSRGQNYRLLDLV